MSLCQSLSETICADAKRAPDAKAPERTILHMAECRSAVQTRFEISSAEMLGQDTSKRIAWPRQIAMALAREFTGASLPKIGRHFGRDHTTVLHAIRRVAAAEESSPSFKGDLDGLRLTLNVYAAQNEQFRRSDGETHCCLQTQPNPRHVAANGADGHRRPRMRAGVTRPPSPAAFAPSTPPPSPLFSNRIER